MMAAPASRHASASAAISSALIGTLGLRSFGVAPLMAASMMTGAAERSSLFAIGFSVLSGMVVPRLSGA